MGNIQQLEAELVYEARADVGEGPVWDAVAGRLLFVDVSPGHVYCLDVESGEAQISRLGQEVGAAIPRQSGGFVAAVRDGIATVDGESLAVVAPIEGDDPSTRMNDAKCDPSGRLWAGTMAFDFAPGRASLYAVERDWTWRRVIGDLTIANGLGWSPDGETMYFIDSPTKRIDRFAFDVATGHLGERELFAVAEDDGMPDGMTVDADGSVWVAFFGGGCVRRYDSDGTHVASVILPVKQVTSCAFGGPDLTDLYITTAAYQLDGGALAQQPLAGSVFTCRPGVAGMPTVSFGG